MTIDDDTIRDDRERRVQEAIRTAPLVRADEGYRQRLKWQFVTGEFPSELKGNGRPSAGRWRRWGWTLLPAAVMLLLVAISLPGPDPSWKVLDALGQGRIVVDEGTILARDPKLPGRSIAAGARVAIADGIILDLVVDDTLLFELADGTDMDLPRRAGRGFGRPLLVELRAGELRLKTGPGFSGKRLHILTADARTEVVGTTVSVYKESELTCVCVLDGEALIGEDEDRLQRIPSGMRKVMFADGRPSMVTEIEPHHKEGLQGFLDRHGDWGK